MRDGSIDPTGAPWNTEDGRALTQSRIAQFGRLLVAIGIVFLIISLAIRFSLDLPGSNVTIVAHIASATVGLCTWRFARRGQRSNTTLMVVDFAAAFGSCLVFFIMGLMLPLFTRPEFLQMICVTDILVVRAFLIPSTARRTAVISTIVALLIVGSTYVMYSGKKVHPDAPGAGVYALVAAILGLGTVIVTTLTSKTIFGLRQRVREVARLGQYTLLEKIGEGGMGIVYKASHAMLRRPTAIKLLAPHRTAEHDLARFEREVQLTSMLTHPNTVAIYDYGRTADGVIYYVMEYLDGIDLETLVQIDGPQEPARVIQLLAQVCGALEEAHGIGLIHRDVKPANILLSARGGLGDVAKVVDFGLVKSVDASSDLTKSAIDQVVGTPLYMSPEAITAPGNLDARSDLYALGALGYFLLTGLPPFTGQTVVEVCGHHLHSAPVPPSDRVGRKLSPALERVILWCLEKAPDRRPSDARALAIALAAVSDVPAWTSERAREWWAKSREKVHQIRRESTAPVSWKDFAVRGTVAVDLQARAAASRVAGVA